MSENTWIVLKPEQTFRVNFPSSGIPKSMSHIFRCQQVELIIWFSTCNIYLTSVHAWSRRIHHPLLFLSVSSLSSSTSRTFIFYFSSSFLSSPDFSPLISFPSSRHQPIICPFFLFSLFPSFSFVILCSLTV